MGLRIATIGLIIIAYATTVYLENRSAPPPGVTTPLLPIGTLGLGLAILGIGLVTAVIGKRAKEVRPP